MNNSIKLIKITRNWQILASLKRKRMSFSKTSFQENEDYPNTTSGHFVVYTVDHRRFVIPLTFLKSNIFRELLKLSEEVFGLPCKGPIKLPCEAVFMEYIVSMIRQGLARNVEQGLLTSIEGCCHSFSTFSLQVPIVCAD